MVPNTSPLGLTMSEKSGRQKEGNTHTHTDGNDHLSTSLGATINRDLWCHMVEKRQNWFLYVKFEFSVNCPIESLISQICRLQFYLAGRWSQLAARSFTSQLAARRSQVAVLGQLRLAGRSYTRCPFRNSIPGAYPAPKRKGVLSKCKFVILHRCSKKHRTELHFLAF